MVHVAAITTTCISISLSSHSASFDFAFASTDRLFFCYVMLIKRHAEFISLAMASVVGLWSGIFLSLLPAPLSPKSPNESINRIIAARAKMIFNQRSLSPIELMSPLDLDQSESQ